jgi:hypothetical protein
MVNADVKHRTRDGWNKTEGEVLVSKAIGCLKAGVRVALGLVLGALAGTILGAVVGTGIAMLTGLL